MYLWFRIISPEEDLEVVPTKEDSAATWNADILRTSETASPEIEQRKKEGVQGDTNSFGPYALFEKVTFKCIKNYF